MMDKIKQIEVNEVLYEIKDEDLDVHIEDSDCHTTALEKEKWNNYSFDSSLDSASKSFFHVKANKEKERVFNLIEGENIKIDIDETKKNIKFSVKESFSFTPLSLISSKHVIASAIKTICGSILNGDFISQETFTDGFIRIKQTGVAFVTEECTLSVSNETINVPVNSFFYADMTIKTDENGIVEYNEQGAVKNVTVINMQLFIATTGKTYKIIQNGVSPIADLDFSVEKGLDMNNPTCTGSFSLNRKIKTTVGYFSFAEGENTTASGNQSHAEGYLTTAKGQGSHAEGIWSNATEITTHAEGYNTNATNYASHAGGKHNAPMTTGGNVSNTTGTAFVIGNGTSVSDLSNAFSVQFNGVVKAKSTITASSTADYAEFFEWLDENKDNEDRVGHFVTLDGDKIRIANSEDDYILGIVSGEPFVLGNGDCDTWNGMYMKDEFNRTIYEPAPKIEEIEITEDREVIKINEETNEEETVIETVVIGHEWKEVLDEEGNQLYQGTRPVINPDYDNTKEYISRFDRKEWSPVGMLGVLSVIDDGTCKVNGFCKCNNEGIATACEKGFDTYRVIQRLTDNVIKVVFK